RAGLPPPRMQVFRVGRPAPAHSACSYPVILQWIPVSEGEVRARDTVANLLELLFENGIQLGIELARGRLELAALLDRGHDHFVRGRLGLVGDERSLDL